MPIYVYEIVRDNTSSSESEEPESFEVLQGMNEPPLKVHPTTGEPVRRVLGAVNVAGMWSEMKTASRLSDKSLNDKGFTKYVKAGDGKYEKRAGKGPDVISKD